MTDQGIEARAAQRAKAREHFHCPICREDGEQLPNHEGRNYCWTHPTRVGDWWCLLNHRTPAEQREACLDALSDAWAWFDAPGEQQSRSCVEQLEAMYDRIQRTEVPSEG